MRSSFKLVSEIYCDYTVEALGFFLSGKNSNSDMARKKRLGVGANCTVCCRWVKVVTEGAIEHSFDDEGGPDIVTAVEQIVEEGEALAEVVL